MWGGRGAPRTAPAPVTGTTPVLLGPGSLWLTEVSTTGPDKHDRNVLVP